MSLKITRREAATSVSAAAAVLLTPQAVVVAQQTPRVPQDSEEEFRAAIDQVRQTSVLLTRFEVPIFTEPACQFKA